MIPKPQKNRDCLESNARKMSRVLSSVYAKGMKESGLKPTQLSLLSVINGYGKINIGELSKVMIMDQTTITRNINVLKKSELVQITAGEDRRVKEISLTDKGQKARQKALPSWQITQGKVWDKLGEEKVRELFSLLNEVIELSEEVWFFLLKYMYLHIL